MCRAYSWASRRGRALRRVVRRSGRASSTECEADVRPRWCGRRTAGPRASAVGKRDLVGRCSSLFRDLREGRLSTGAPAGGGRAGGQTRGSKPAGFGAQGGAA